MPIEKGEIVVEKSYVFADGKIVPEEEVSISIRCKALNYGLGCFEGIRAYWNEEEGQLYGFKFEDHYKRLKQSCKAIHINLPYSVEELCDITVELLKANNFKTTTYIRPLAFKGSNSIQPTLYGDDDDRFVIYCMPMGKFAGKEELHVGVSSWRRISDTMLPPRVKATASYLNSALASLEVLENGFDEAILLTQEGYVSEGPGENLFLVRDGKLITPAVSENILEGVTRKVVMELAQKELGIEVVERRVTRTELYAADEMFFSGTAMEVTPIVSVDRRKVGDGKAGDVYKALKKLFFDITINKNAKYSSWCTPVY